MAATRLKRALAKGAKLIVADPRKIELAELGRSLSADSSGFRYSSAFGHGSCYFQEKVWH